MTIADIYWYPIYDRNHAIPVAVATRCIDLMLATSQEANRFYRGSGGFDESKMQAKVRYYKNVNGVDVNYMKVLAGRDTNSANGKIDVVVIYHWLGHRQMWGLSVGFDQSASFVSDLPTGGSHHDVDDDTYSYVILAKAIAKKVHSDFSSSSWIPSGQTSVMYDEIDTNDDPNGTPGQIASRRRVTKIGELGWVFQKNKDISQTTGTFPGKFRIVPRRETFPTTSDGYTIPRKYCQNGADHIVITELTLR